MIGYVRISELELAYYLCTFIADHGYKPDTKYEWWQESRGLLNNTWFWDTEGYTVGWF